MSDLTNILPNIEAVKVFDNEVSMSVFVAENIDYFKGHFPQASILPGVVQLDWAIHFAREYLSISNSAVKNVEVLKFQEVITPNMKVTLLLTLKSADKFTFKYISAKGTHASGRIVLEET
ncbi:thioester dehydrase [Thalassotalea sp. 1_MG-2023]|uniref:ApeI family dehydratase n=1 Tax=Thalassotalea sp. 1_MG-2023 TaxID=3062680 RepID=UPI0026E3A942|nr:thioester dehydrase [Thalassotalea sp. 1_MG-2023]MDO6426636.1 thioester dehydrase [Thalassotalea sp. 1_MG-2023]